MSAVRGWLWFALAFTLVVAVGSARAETIPAITVYTSNWSDGTYSTAAEAGIAGCAGQKAYVGASASAACQSFLSVPPGGGGFYGVTNRTPSGEAIGSVSAVSGCPVGGGYTLSGGQCTRADCPSGQTRNSSTGVCEASCPAAGSNAMIGGAQAWGISGSSGTCTSGIAYGGCKITCTSGVSASGKASCTGCTFTGGPSTSGDVVADPTTGEEIKTPTKPEECLAKGQGYVTTSSGTTCVAQDQAVEPISTKTTETTTTKNGSGVTTGTE